MIKARHLLGNVPLVGRYLYPVYNKYSIFSKPGKYFPFAHQQPLDSWPKGKIVIFGLPKAGNTWIVSLLCDYLDLKGLHLYKDKGKKGVGMLHDPLNYRFKVRRDFARGVYIMRDMRDSIVSYYHYTQTDYYKELNDPYVNYTNISTFYHDYFLNKLVYRYDWHNHAEGFVSHGVPVIRYEDLYDDPVAAFTALIARMGLPVDEAKAAQAVENNELKRLKKSGKELWHKVPKTHFRKGGYGGYKNEMPPELIARINHQWGEYLTRWGYDV